VSEPSNEVYLLILNLTLLSIISILVEKPQGITYLVYVKNVRAGSASFNFLDVLNIIVLVMVFAESYILSGGYFFPYLSKIDIHVASLGMYSAILRSLDLLVFLVNYLQYYSTNKRLYLFFNTLLIVVNLITNGSRFLVFMMIVSLFVEYLMYNPLKKKRKTWIFIILIFVVIAIFLVISVLRLNNYDLQANITYKNLILYNGPFSETEFLGELFSTYYGYFPLSFNNLNLSIEKFKSYNFQHSYGQLFLSPLTVGIFKLNKLFDLNYFQAVYDVTEVTNAAATVPTGLFSAYIDFGNLNIVCLTLWFLVSLFFVTNIHRSPFFLVNYAGFATFWFTYTNFLDYFLTAVPLYLFILSFMFFQYFTTVEEVNISGRFRKQFTPGQS